MLSAILYVVLGYGLAQILSVKALKAMYAAVRKWIASFGKDGVGDSDDYKAGGSSSED